jgi:uncharacterized protein (DUF1800 family)
MKRRTFIAIGLGVTAVGIESCSPDNKIKNTISAVQKNPLTKLKRLTIGFSLRTAFNSLKELETLTAEHIIKKQEKLGFPINFEFSDDRTVKIGETWIDAVYRLDVFYEQYRKKSLRSWLIQEMISKECSIQKQMMLFWLNHFAIADIIEHKFEYIHINLLHTSAFGNIKKLVKDISIDPAMLRYLNGAENTKSSPNENYARELLELFTLGKGIQIAEGNYTTYTEEDIRECAKILTGWRDKGWFTRDEDLKPGAEFIAFNHDNSTKKLSKSFGCIEILDEGENEFKKLIDAIFARKETALNFAQKLVTWFVGDEPQKNETLVCKVADILFEQDYEIMPAILYLTQCEEINSTTNLRVKSPAQYVLGILSAIPLEKTADLKQQGNYYYTIFKLISEMGMELLKPPGVAGWKAYYQYPILSKQWVNASAQIKRAQFVKKLFFEGIEADDINLKADMPAFLNQFSKLTIRQVVDTSIYYFHPIYDEVLANKLLNDLLIVCDEKSWNESLSCGIYSDKQIESIKSVMFSVVMEPQTNLI